MNWTNPAENSLPARASLSDVEAAVKASGYPLQSVIAAQLQPDFNVVEEWGYTDRTTGENRALDLFAYRQLSSDGDAAVLPAMALLIECKRAELPHVFFRAVTASNLTEFPLIAGLRGVINLRESHRSRDLPIPFVLGLQDHEFCRLAPISRVLARVEAKGSRLELSGTEPFNSTVLPLISAIEFWRDYRESGGGQRIWPTLSLAIHVLDGPMVLAEGTPDQPKLSFQPWIRLTRQEAARLDESRTADRKNFVIDVVHRQFFGEYVRRAMELADWYARSVAQQQMLLLMRQGWVENIDTWTPGTTIRPKT